MNACNQKVFLAVYKQNSQIQPFGNLRNTLLHIRLSESIRIKT